MRRDATTRRNDTLRRGKQLAGTSLPSASQSVRTDISSQGAESFQGRASAARRIHRVDNFLQ